MNQVIDTEYYDLLGVKPDAPLDDIKKSFKKLASKWHPDKWLNSSQEQKETAEQKFKDINQAYETLRNEDTREKYNRFGKEGVKDIGGQMSEEVFKEFFGNMGDFMGGLGGFMGGMGGMGGIGGMGGMFGRRDGERRELVMSNITHVLNVELNQIYLGSSIEFEITRYNLKNGANPTKEQMICRDCKGQGTVVKLKQMGPGMFQQLQESCRKCEGQGIYLSDEFFVKEKKKFNRSIPKGIISNQKIVIDNQGNEIPQCFKDRNVDQERSDLILKIAEKPIYQTGDYKYVRGDGRHDSPFNLHIEMTIDIHEAICGTIKNIPFINGENVNIKIPQGIAFTKNHLVVVPKLGIPYYKQKNAYGDLIIVLIINKTKISEDQCEKIWNIFTNTSMSKSMKEVLKKEKDKYVDAMTLEEYKNSNASKKSRQKYEEYENKMKDEDDDDDNNRQSVQCAQQ